jgi:UDP-N-acetylglucosamine 2-epimerase (non-hydrolysing)/UDP-GlcNAc3NAcA epimerase
MCCTQSAFDFLTREGLDNRAVLVGDPMYDAFLYYGQRLPQDILTGIVDINKKNIEIPQEYYYLTCHREENTHSDEPLLEILKAMQSLDAPTVYPVHPRNMEVVRSLCKTHGFDKILPVMPVGYLSSIALVKGSKKVITDSGGVQREAYFAKKQCVTVFDYVVWPETMVGNANQLAKPQTDDIIEKLALAVKWDNTYNPFGDGNSGEKIAEAIEGLRLRT